MSNTISVHDLPEVTKRFTKLAAKATKYGVAEPTLTVSDPFDYEVDVYCDQVKIRTIATRAVEVEIEMPAQILIEGWDIVAAVDVDDEGHNVVRSISDTGTPAWVRDVDRGRCDHCHTNRRRKALVVIRNATTDEWRVIGRSCARDYIGVDLTSFLNWHDLSYGFDYPSIPDEIDWEHVGEGYEVHTIDVISVAADLISRVGYHKSGEEFATRDDARTYFWKPAEVERDFPKAKVEPVSATDALEWARNLPGHNDFELNLIAVASRETVNHKHWGILCYIPEGYRRHLARQAEKAAEAEAPDPGHWGTVGKREVLCATVTGVNVVEGFYGESAWIKATTADGHRIDWKASQSANWPEPGDVITGKATVKEHGEWQGRSVTRVTRWAWNHVDVAAA